MCTCDECCKRSESPNKIIKDKGQMKWELIIALSALRAKGKDDQEEVTCKLKSGEWVRVNVRLQEKKRERTEHFRE